jgi:hypothetical protein
VNPWTFIVVTAHRAYRVFQYARLGWGSHDWDYSYLLELVEFKLERMAKFSREGGIHVGYLRRAAEMDALRRVLQNIREDKPEIQTMDEFGWIFETDSEEGQEKFRAMRAREEELWAEEFRKLDLILRRRLRWWWD